MKFAGITENRFPIDDRDLSDYSEIFHNNKMKCDNIYRMNNTVKSTFFLTLTAMVWGAGTVAQKYGMDYMGPALFQGMRNLFAALALFTVLCIGNRFKSLAFDKRIIKGGIFCGIFLTLSVMIQQIGIVGVAAGKAGFLTTFYVVLVPIFGIFLRKKTHWNTWTSVVIAMLGLYFLCLKPGTGFTIDAWDMVVIISCIFFACHILCVDSVVEDLTSNEVMKLCVVQFVFAGFCGVALAPVIDGFFVENIFDPEKIKGAMIAILYSGIISSGIGYTFQAIGQRYANPSATSILLSLESVFSVIFGMLILSERMTGREFIGCLILFIAVTIAQLPERPKPEKMNSEKHKPEKLKTGKH